MLRNRKLLSTDTTPYWKILTSCDRLHPKFRHTENTARSMGDGSVAKVPATEALGLAFGSQELM